MIVAGLVVLLWRPVVTTRLAIVAGLILGASAAVHQIGEILVLPAVAYLILTVDGGWRRILRQSAVLVAAFVLPILVYCSGSLYVTGHFWLASSADQNLGRLAVSADCATLKLPSYLRQMCPSPSVQANGADWLEHSKNSPLHNPVVPPGMTKGQMLAQLESAIEHQQPLRVLGSFLRDSARLFAGSRTAIQGITPISRWQFQTHYPVFPPEVSLGAGNKIIVGIQRAPYEPFHERLLRPSYGGQAQVDKPIASFLRSYQLKGGYTPGPLLALATILGAIGTLFVLRRRQRGTRAAGAGHRLPAVLRHGRADPADLRLHRVLLALPAPGAGHPAARGRPGSQRAGGPVPGPPPGAERVRPPRGGRGRPAQPVGAVRRGRLAAYRTIDLSGGQHRAPIRPGAAGRCSRRT